MRAGTLRHRLKIEQPVDSERDAAGHFVEKWKVFATVWGRVEETAQSETQRTDQNQPVGVRTITIRYLKGVDSTMRVCWQDENRTFGIEGVTKDERNFEMTLSCREK